VPTSFAAGTRPLNETGRRRLRFASEACQRMRDGGSTTENYEYQRVPAGLGNYYLYLMLVPCTCN
jgi:hypothetical protein